MVTPSDPALELRPRRTRPWLAVFYVVGSFGLILPLWGVALLLDRRPRAIDREGITLAWGRRHRWRDLVGVSPRQEHRRVIGGGLVVVNWWLHFQFTTGSVTFHPGLFEDGWGAVAHVERLLGRTFERPPARPGAPGAS